MTLELFMDLIVVMIFGGMGAVIRSFWNGKPLSNHNTFEIFLVGACGGLIGLSIVALILGSQGFTYTRLSPIFFGVFVVIGFVTPDIFNFILKKSRSIGQKEDN